MTSTQKRPSEIVLERALSRGHIKHDRECEPQIDTPKASSLETDWINSILDTSNSPIQFPSSPVQIAARPRSANGSRINTSDNDLLNNSASLEAAAAVRRRVEERVSPTVKATIIPLNSPAITPPPERRKARPSSGAPNRCQPITVMLSPCDVVRKSPSSPAIVKQRSNSIHSPQTSPKLRSPLPRQVIVTSEKPTHSLTPSPQISVTASSGYEEGKKSQSKSCNQLPFDEDLHRLSSSTSPIAPELPLSQPIQQQKQKAATNATSIDISPTHLDLDGQNQLSPKQAENVTSPKSPSSRLKIPTSPHNSSHDSNSPTSVFPLQALPKKAKSKARRPHKITRRASTESVLSPTQRQRTLSQSVGKSAPTQATKTSRLEVRTPIQPLGGYHTVYHPLSEATEQTLNDFAIGKISFGEFFVLERGAIDVGTSGNLTVNELPGRIAKHTEPRFYLFKFIPAVNEEEITFFIYYCPTTSSIRSRMIYATTKPGLIQQAKLHGIEIHKKMEISEASETTRESLVYQLIPPEEMFGGNCTEHIHRHSSSGNLVACSPHEHHNQAIPASLKGNGDSLIAELSCTR